MNFSKLPLWIVLPALSAVTIRLIFTYIIPQSLLVLGILNLIVIGFMPIYAIHFYVNINDWSKKRHLNTSSRTSSEESK